MAKGGFTMWARKTIDSDIFKIKPAEWFKIWFFLVNRVNHADNGQFKRGECFTTYGEIIRETLATKGQIDKCVRWLKKERMLATRKSTRGMHIKVLNYNRYQSVSEYKSDTTGDKHATSKRHAVDTINKNVRMKELKKRTTGQKPEASTPFDMATELKKLDDSPRRDLQIIAFYFEERRITFENQGQFNTALRRHLRPAKDLTPFTDKQLVGAVREAKRRHADIEWTLETLIKILTK